MSGTVEGIEYMLPQEQKKEAHADGPGGNNHFLPCVRRVTLRAICGIGVCSKFDAGCH